MTASPAIRCRAPSGTVLQGAHAQHVVAQQADALHRGPGGRQGREHGHPVDDRRAAQGVLHPNEPSRKLHLVELSVGLDVSKRSPGREDPRRPDPTRAGHPRHLRPATRLLPSRPRPRGRGLPGAGAPQARRTGDRRGGCGAGTTRRTAQAGRCQAQAGSEARGLRALRSGTGLLRRVANRSRTDPGSPTLNGGAVPILTAKWLNRDRSHWLEWPFAILTAMLNPWFRQTPTSTGQYLRSPGRSKRSGLTAPP